MTTYRDIGTGAHMLPTFTNFYIKYPFLPFFTCEGALLNACAPLHFLNASYILEYIYKLMNIVKLMTLLILTSF